MVSQRPELADNRTVIIDKGLATKDNLAHLQSAGFHYIIASRHKYPYQPDDDMTVIREKASQGVKVEVKRYEKDGEVHLLCRSNQRKAKEKGIRTRQEDIFLERLDYYKTGLKKKNRTKSYPKLLEMIGRLRQKYPGASKLYDVDVIAESSPGENTQTKAKNIVWTKRAKADDEEQQEGSYLLRTDRTDLEDKEIWETYTMLTRVKKAFRCLKSSLGIRPNFHQKEHRADAHVFITVLAYHLLHAIEHQLRSHGEYRSWSTIRKLLSTHHRLTLSYDEKDKNTTRRHHMRMCSLAEPSHQEIYRSLGLAAVPIQRKSLIS